MGWEVSYGAEFVPNVEGTYTVNIQLILIELNSQLNRCIHIHGDHLCSCSLGFMSATTYQLHDSSTHFTKSFTFIDLLITKCLFSLRA